MDRKSRTRQKLKTLNILSGCVFSFVITALTYTNGNENGWPVALTFSVVAWALYHVFDLITWYAACLYCECELEELVIELHEKMDGEKESGNE